jgi:adenosine deaminase
VISLRFTKRVIAGLALTLSGMPPQATSSVDAYLTAVRDDPGRLEEFMAELPNGGDLHTHLSGAVPTGTLIGLAAGDRLCVDTATYVATSALRQGPAARRRGRRRRPLP